MNRHSPLGGIGRGPWSRWRNSGMGDWLASPRLGEPLLLFSFTLVSFTPRLVHPSSRSPLVSFSPRLVHPRHRHWNSGGLSIHPPRAHGGAPAAGKQRHDRVPGGCLPASGMTVGLRSFSCRQLESRIDLEALL